MFERSTRCLSKIGTASSNRVLNLNAIGLRNVENPAHNAAPLFLSRVFNQAIILKHRLRANEAELFSDPRSVATKIIIPFEKKNLRSGGRSMCVDQSDFEQIAKEVGNYRSDAEFARDLTVMRLIDRLPSLDPFLLREQLRTNGITANSSYFDLSSADQQRMHGHALKELSRLTRLVDNGSKSSAHNATIKMATALLSYEVDEKLEPMRNTLGLNRDEFCEGVFSWRGFIYYKWTVSDLFPSILQSLRELKGLAPVGTMSSDEKVYFAESKTLIMRGTKSNIDTVGAIIGIYDNAYGSLIERQNPAVFRDFLLTAPSLFLEVGERIGALYHMNSFWKYRFPAGSSKHAEFGELITIFEDFKTCVCDKSERLTILAA